MCLWCLPSAQGPNRSSSGNHLDEWFVLFLLRTRKKSSKKLSSKTRNQAQVRILSDRSFRALEKKDATRMLTPSLRSRPRTNTELFLRVQDGNGLEYIFRRFSHLDAVVVINGIAQFMFVNSVRSHLVSVWREVRKREMWRQTSKTARERWSGFLALAQAALFEAS